MKLYVGSIIDFGEVKFRYTVTEVYKDSFTVVSSKGVENRHPLSALKAWKKFYSFTIIHPKSHYLKRFKELIET